MATREEKLAEIKRLEKIAEIQALEAQVAAQSQDRSVADNIRFGGEHVRSGLEGLTFGLSEPVISGATALGANVIESAREAEGLGDFADKMIDPARYEQFYDEDVADRRQFKADNPLKDAGMQMAGAVAPALITGGASLPASAAKALPATMTAAGRAAVKGAQAIPIAGRLLKGEGVAANIVRGGVDAAAQGAASEFVQGNVLEATGFAKEGERGSELDAAQGGAALGTGLAALGQTGKVLKGLAKIFTKVDSADIDHYMANRDRVVNAKSVEDIKLEMDSIVEKMRDDVDAGKLSVDDAKEFMREANADLKNVIRENKALLGAQKADARQAVRDAQRTVDFIVREKKAEIKSARPPVNPDDVLDSVEDVKRNVVETSQESYKILGDLKGKFPIGNVPSAIDKIQDGLKINGQLLSVEAKSANNMLEGYKSQLAQMGDQVPYTTAKKILQEIDSDLRRFSDKRSGEFNDRAYNSLMEVRRAIDQQIKERSPDYAAVMEEVSRLNGLRREFVKAFGTREATTAKLLSMARPQGEANKNLLENLGAETGKDFKTALDEYVSTKMMGQSPTQMQDYIQALPESGDLRQAEMAAARLNRPNVMRDLEAKLSQSSPEASRLRQAETNLVASQNQLGTAQAALKPYQSVTPQNSENIIRSLMGDPNKKIELRRMVKSLSQVSDADFEVMINDLRVRDQFDKGIIHGSNNPVTYGGIMGALGLMMGDPTFGMASAGAGAAVGKFMDTHGPKVTRKVLDGVLAIKGIPTVKKLESTFADLPESVREDLRTSLIRSVQIGNNTGSVRVPDAHIVDVLKDIKDSSMSNVQKAKAMNQLNKEKTISSDVSQSLMMGDATPVLGPVSGPQLRPNPAPQNRSLNDVTDFIKTKKVEPY